MRNFTKYILSQWFRQPSRKKRGATFVQVFLSSYKTAILHRLFQNYQERVGHRLSLLICPLNLNAELEHRAEHRIYNIAALTIRFFALTKTIEERR